MKFIVSVFLIVVSLLANEYKEKDTISRHSFVDQFDNVKTINNETKMIIYINSSTIDILNQYINNKNILLNKNYVVLYDVSDSIPFIFKFYTLPKLQTLNYNIKLDFTHRGFIQEDDFIIIYFLNNFEITQIVKVKDKKDLIRYMESI